MKNGFKRAFIDTALFIYLLEEQADFSDLTESFLNFCYANQVSLVTSIITHLEFCVKPYREQRLDVIDDYNSVIDDADTFVTSLTLLECDRAARLRAKYTGLKSFDALQIALAIKEGCDLFACNDKRLKSIKDIEILTLDALEDFGIS
ncbi:MAG: type II toxin-antitoxin system VapC family toxin [bacterium]|nr:type II toxin-antitoxin system VapC family toxin [bacterium]